jgi:hypothetical protein
VQSVIANDFIASSPRSSTFRVAAKALLRFPELEQFCYFSNQLSTGYVNYLLMSNTFIILWRFILHNRPS